jgi:hypothetical protein
MTQKVRYEIDPHNRLISDITGGKGGLNKFRKVLDGRFRIDENNNLSYHIKSPHHSVLRTSGAGQALLVEDDRIPHQIKLKGEWSLTDNHDLRLTLDKWGRATFGDQITLQGEILDVDERSLSFAITTTTKENTQSTYVLNLGGSWKADASNRLSFHVRRERGGYDILAFNGAWEINKNHQIIYQYEKAELIRKKRQTHALIFKGRWDIKDSFRISYLLSGSSDSALDFTASAGIFKGDYIKYEVGIGSSNRALPETRTVTLFGKWRLKRDVGLIFEAEYEDGKTKRMVFGAEASLTGKDTVLFKLKNDVENKDMGVNLELSRKVLKGDGEAFLRLLKSNRESAVYAGAAWRW